ncbi:DUF3888 domain-containing protein [Peribacillus butanolivorans]|uniref:DUF3888 domain-containing protein n=1 Tax=Peribacillus butanolivorans TaxID=421767 RepID=UPI00364F1E28
MKKFLIIFFSVFFILTIPIQANSQKENKIDYEKTKYALIASLSPAINEAVAKIYKDIPGGDRQWAGWETEILSIKQLYGIGGAYRITVKIHTYVGAHNPPNGIDTITIEVGGGEQKIIKYEHKED